MNAPARDARTTVPGLVARKAEGRRFAVLTAYDYPTARVLDEAGIEVLLVGDSLGMVVLGRPDTLTCTMDEMIHHTRAVSRAARRALVVGDMPYLSFHLSPEDTVRNGARFLREGGASAVKLEGASPARLRAVEALVEAEIPVMGHVGLTPQSIARLGRFQVRGKESREAMKIVEDARALERAGAFAVVLESMPLEVARLATKALSIPTIGIGAGPHCDGQVLVFHDLMGFTHGYLPKFVRRYADMEGVIREAAAGFLRDVETGAFPGDAESYHLDAAAARELEGAEEAPPSAGTRPRPKRGRPS